MAKVFDMRTQPGELARRVFPAAPGMAEATFAKGSRIRVHVLAFAMLVATFLVATFLAVTLACAILPATAHATYRDVAEEAYASQTLDVSGTPIDGSQIPDGNYSVNVTTSSSMCNVSNCVLTVANGQLYATFNLTGAYSAIYFGTAAEAAAQTNDDGTDASQYYLGDPPEGYVTHAYAIQISALNTPIDIATYSGGKDFASGRWWSRQFSFNSKGEVDAAIANAANPSNGSGNAGETGDNGNSGDGDENANGNEQETDPVGEEVPIVETDPSDDGQTVDEFDDSGDDGLGDDGLGDDGLGDEEADDDQGHTVTIDPTSGDADDADAGGGDGTTAGDENTTNAQDDGEYEEPEQIAQGTGGAGGGGGTADSGSGAGSSEAAQKKDASASAESASRAAPDVVMGRGIRLASKTVNPVDVAGAAAGEPGEPEERNALPLVVAAVVVGLFDLGLVGAFLIGLRRAKPTSFPRI